MKNWVKQNFNKAAFVNVSFSDFKKGWAGKLRGHDITEVAELLGINTIEKKEEYKPKSMGKNKK